jgi:hypothetical protein
MGKMGNINNKQIYKEEGTGWRSRRERMKETRRLVGRARGDK